MPKSKASKTKPCPPKTPLPKRPLIEQRDAKNLEQLFKTLANDTRIRLIHALAKHGELCVSDLATQLEMKPQALSNQLQKLAAAKMLASRRDGNSIFYRIVDPCVPSLLHKGLCLLEDSASCA